MIKIKKTIFFLIATLFISSVFLHIASTSVEAQIPAGCPGSDLAGPPTPGSCDDSRAEVEECFGGGRSNQQIADCVEQLNSGSEGSGGADAPPPLDNDQRNALRDCKGTAGECLEANPIRVWVVYLINFLSAGVGVIVTIMIIVGGIQYASAGGNPQAVQAAKKKIANSIIALIAYFFLFAFLQWLVPGGLF